MNRGITSVLLCTLFLVSAIAFNGANVRADSVSVNNIRVDNPGSRITDDTGNINQSPLEVDKDSPVQPWSPNNTTPVLYPTEWELCYSPSRYTVRVPKEAYTIQDAINRVKEDGTIIVEKGQYRENIRIPSYKKIILRGTGEPNETRITALNRYLPALSVDGGGSACLESLKVEGGKVAILAGEWNGTAPGPRARGIVLRQVEVVEATHGFVSLSDSTHVRRSSFTSNTGWGGVIIGPRAIVTLTRISENGAGGLVLYDSRCSGAADFDLSIGLIMGNFIEGNDGPGLVLCRGGVTVFLNTITDNRMAGVYVLDAEDPVFIVNNMIADTAGFDPGDGVLRWGEGILANNSPSVNVVANFIINNNQAGIYFINSGGMISANIIMYNVFSIALEGGADPEILWNLIMFNDRNEVSRGLGLEPAPPLERIEP